MPKRLSAPIAAALAIAIAATSLDIAPAYAAAKHPQQTAKASETIDFSARRRHYRGGNRAAFGAVLGVFGTIAALAAADQYRNDNYYYGGGPYYYGSPGYYGGGGYYRGGGGYSRHHHHRHH
ncbi:MAG: hypothetical protein ABI830_13740 [Pseudolabrys sp.]